MRAFASSERRQAAPISEAALQQQSVRATIRLRHRMLQDIRYALRNLRRTPLFTIVALFSLALGIGANSAVFTIADQVLLRLIPVKYARQLVYFTSPGPQS